MNKDSLYFAVFISLVAVFTNGCSDEVQLIKIFVLNDSLGQISAGLEHDIEGAKYEFGTSDVTMVKLVEELDKNVYLEEKVSASEVSIILVPVNESEIFYLARSHECGSEGTIVSTEKGFFCSELLYAKISSWVNEYIPTNNVQPAFRHRLADWLEKFRSGEIFN